MPCEQAPHWTVGVRTAGRLAPAWPRGAVKPAAAVLPVTATRLASRANPANNASILRGAGPGQIANRLLVILMFRAPLLWQNSMDFPPIPRDHTAPCPAAPPHRRSEKMTMT